MHKGLRLADLNNYLDIVYWFKTRYCVYALVDLNNYLDIMYMLKIFYDVFFN